MTPPDMDSVKNEFKKAAESPWIVELTLVVAYIGLVAASLFADWLPQPFLKMRETHTFLITIVIVTFWATIWRLIACIFAYTKNFSTRITCKVNWSIVVVCLVAFVTSFFDAYSASRESQGITVDSSFFIKESEATLTVLCNGGGEFERIQKIVPSADLDSIVELDFFATGGFVDSNVTFTIWEVTDGDNSIPIDCKTYVVHDRIINRFARRLQKGQEYGRSMVVNAVSAYADTVSDAFTIIVNHPMSSLVGKVKFEDGCNAAEHTIRFELIKSKGASLSQPQQINCEHKTSNYVKFTVYSPDVGNAYRVTWAYKPGEGPRVPSRSALAESP